MVRVAVEALAAVIWTIACRSRYLFGSKLKYESKRPGERMNAGSDNTKWATKITSSVDFYMDVPEQRSEGEQMPMAIPDPENERLLRLLWQKRKRRALFALAPPRLLRRLVVDLRLELSRRNPSP